MVVEGGKEEFYGKHPDRRIQCGCDLEKVVGGDDIDLKWFDASRLVAHLGSKLWSQRKINLCFTLIS